MRLMQPMALGVRDLRRGFHGIEVAVNAEHLRRCRGGRSKAIARYEAPMGSSGHILTLDEEPWSIVIATN